MPIGARTPLRFTPIASDTAHDARVAAISTALGRLCAELRIPFLDLHGPLSTDETWRAESIAEDGAHPNAGGYARAAALIEAWPPWMAWTLWQSDEPAQ
jgi:acyl-CoA thioesterase I